MRKECKDCECYRCRERNTCFECRNCVGQANFTDADKSKCCDRKLEE